MKHHFCYFSTLRYLPDYSQNIFCSGQCAVNVWGAISKEGLGPLVRIEGSFTPEEYCNMITHHLLPFLLDGPFPDGDFQFQQDRSPVHTACKVAALLDHYVVRQLNWPPKGADLNPIENVWGLLKQLSTHRDVPTTADSLWMQ